MSDMGKYRKKPVVIEAMQWTGENLREIIAFTDGPPNTRSHHAGMMWEQYELLVAEKGLIIFTLEGQHIATIGDWIIKGVKGEHYPCKPDVFEMTYEPVNAITALPALLAEANARADRAEAALAAHEWQPIETAPKGGARIMLWRGATSCGKWSEMVIAEWLETAWCWPDSRENPSTHGEWTEDELIDGYADSKSFTHWRPLPVPPGHPKPHDRTTLDRMLADACEQALREAARMFDDDSNISQTILALIKPEEK